MNAETFDRVTTELHAEAARIAASKRPGYTGGSVDILANFKGVAARLGLTPEQVWCVYFLKHVDAIVSIMAKPDLPVSEAPLGRFSDGHNYLDLGWALVEERQDEAEKSKVPYKAPIDITFYGTAKTCLQQCGMYLCVKPIAHIGWHEAAGGFTW